MVSLANIQKVYADFQSGLTSTTVTRRRFQAGGSVTGASGLRGRGPYIDEPIAVFIPPANSSGQVARGNTRRLGTVGAEGRGSRTLYSTSEFLTEDSNLGRAADVVFTPDGRAYTVVSVNPWVQSGQLGETGYEVSLADTGRRIGEVPNA